MLAAIGLAERAAEAVRRGPLDAAVRDLIHDEGEDSPALSDHPVAV